MSRNWSRYSSDSTFSPVSILNLEGRERGTAMSSRGTRAQGTIDSHGNSIQTRDNKAVVPEPPALANGRLARGAWSVERRAASERPTGFNRF